MRNGIWVFMVIGLPICMAGCASAPPPPPAAAAAPPEITYDGMRLTDRSLAGETMAYTFLAVNKSGVEVRLTNLKYKFLFGGEQVAEETLPTAVIIAPGQSRTFDVPVHVKYPGDYKKMVDLTAKKETEFSLQGTVDAATGTVPFAAGGSILLPVIPAFSFAQTGVSKDGENAYGMSLDLVVKNDNLFKLSVRKIDYDLFIEGKQISKGTIGMEDSVPPNSTVVYTVNAMLNPETVGKDLLKKISSAPSFDFEMKGEMRLQEFSVPIHQRGSMKFSR